MWSATIRTGNPEVDLKTVEQHRAQARQQGLVLHVQPLPHGGYYVQALAAGAPPPGSGAHDPGPQFTGTLPSLPQPAPANPPLPMPAIPMPAPQVVDPAAQFGGTMPSRPGGYAARIQPVPEVHMHPSAQYSGVGQCQACGREGPTKHMTFMQNIGVLVIRFPKTVNGHLCKFCIDKYFLKMTLITLFFGWWGVISFFYTLVSLPVNVVNRIRAIGMESPREDEMSVAEKRSRGLWLILGSIPFVIVMLLHLAFVAISIVAGEKIGDVLVMFFLGLVFIDAPALLLLVSGIRNRVLAARAAKQLGI